MIKLTKGKANEREATKEIPSDIKIPSMDSTAVAHAVLSFNHPEITKKCLQSILPRVPIFLLHHGSMEKHINAVRDEFPQIHHLETSDNRDYSGGANILIDRAFSSLREAHPTKRLWLYFYTNDTELLELPKSLPEEPGLYAPLIFRRRSETIDSLGGVAQFTSANEEIKLQHCRGASEFLTALGEFNYFIKRNKTAARESNNIWDIAVDLSKQTSRSQRAEQLNLGTPPVRMPYIPGTAFLIDFQTYQNLLQPHFFDPTYHTYWEDVDLSLRAQLAGVAMQPIESWKLRHGVGKTCHKDKFYTSELYPRNREIFKAKLLRFLES